MTQKKSTMKMMRMKDLTEAASVPRGTIQFYIREGLIPRPIKQTSNSAFYTEEHLNDILLVKELQSKRYLPLSVIKEVMTGSSGKLSVDEIKTLVELNGKVFSNISESPQLKPLTAKQLSKKTGMSEEELEMMERFGVATPDQRDGKKLFGEDDIRLAECRMKLIQAGLTPELGFHVSIIKVYKEIIEKLVERESKIFTPLLTGKFETEKIAKILEAVTPIVNTIISIMHKKEIENTIKRYVNELDGSKNLSDREEGESP